jgi:hypothetical protein
MDRPAPEVRNYAVIFPRLPGVLLCRGLAAAKKNDKKLYYEAVEHNVVDKVHIPDVILMAA